MGHALLTGLRAPKEPLPRATIAITSPPGSSGKTTLATNLAIELAKRSSTLLIDGDPLAPTVAAHFGIGELTAGLASALRIASQGRFDNDQLQRLAIPIAKTGLSLLIATSPLGTSTQAAASQLVSVARQSFDFVIIDCGQLTCRTAGEKDKVSPWFHTASNSLVVALADPIGIYRLLEVAGAIEAFLPNPTIVINRLRNSVLDRAREEIEKTIAELSALQIMAMLPEDAAHLDQAMKSATVAALGGRGGAYRQGIAQLARQLAPPQLRSDSRLAKLG